MQICTFCAKMKQVFTPTEETDMRRYIIFALISMTIALLLVTAPTTTAQDDTRTCDPAALGAIYGVQLIRAQTTEEQLEILDAMRAEIAMCSDTAVQRCSAYDANCYPHYVDINVGLTDSGYATAGPDDAPIIVAEFGDFACPHCTSYHPTFRQLIDEFARTEAAQFWFVPMTGVGGERSRLAYQAAYCAGEQAAFWQFHAEIFAVQEAEGAREFTRETFLRIGHELQLDVDALDVCMNSPQSTTGLTNAADFARSLGVNATPTVMYSTDGGETWTQFDSRSYDVVSAQIMAANE